MRQIKFIFGLFVLFILGTWIVNSYIVVVTKEQIYQHADEAPTVELVVVPGASVYRSGELSPALQQRVDKALDYISKEDSIKILFSGYAIKGGYNEPKAMVEYSKNHGTPDEKILVDTSGSSTYATLLYCKKELNVTSLLFVSQQFHLPRAVYIGNSLGMNSFGLAADTRISKNKKYFREYFSRMKDFLLLKLFGFFR